MKEPSSVFYQFKITLVEVKPAIWRRIQVPASYTFWDLHVAIQDAMGWQDYHLHEFEIANPTTGNKSPIGIPDDETEWAKVTLPGWELAIADYFTMENQDAGYTYDFGDDWQHRIHLETIEQADPEQEYPRCIAGARACPPEDVGGTWGYEEFLRVIKDPNHPRHLTMLEWVGGSFEPDEFDADEVWFDDPQARWRFAVGDEDAA